MKKTSEQSEHHGGKNVPGFWKRTLAFIFDLLIINLFIFWPFEGVFAPYSDLVIDPFAGTLYPGLFSVVVIMMFLAVCYFAFFEYYLGQTPGKMLYRMKIVDAQGTAPSLWIAFARNIYLLPLFPLYILWIVEPIHLAFYKERFLEKFTKTKTVFVDIYEHIELKKV